MTHLVRARAIRFLPLLLARCVAACGQAQQGGGFHGFPPAEVTTLKVEPKTLPASFEYVGQTTGSKEVEVRARVTGILEKKLFQEGAPVKAGQALFVIDPEPLQAQTAALEAEVVARAGADRRRAEREVARLKPLAERRAVGQKEADDAVSNAEIAAAQLQAPPRRSSRRSSSTWATRASPRRSPACRAARRNRKAASSTPTKRCSPRSRRSIRCGSRSRSPRTSSSCSTAR